MVSPLPLKRQRVRRPGRPTAARIAASKRSQTKWPLWVRLAVYSVVFYVFVATYFFASYELSIQRDDAKRMQRLSNTGEGDATSASDDSKRQRTKLESTTLTKGVSQRETPNQPPFLHATPAKLFLEGDSFHFDKSHAEAALQRYGPSAMRQILTAHVEPPMNDTIPHTGSRGDDNNDKDYGTPPQYYSPLPLRTHSPDDLRIFQYPKLQTCHDVPAKIPVDRGLQMDSVTGNPIITNVGDKPTPPDFAETEAPYCPVEADPYLPWIHDFFPSVDGRLIQFVAQNKRRCRTGRKFGADLERLAPQVALMQSVSVERLSEASAQALAPELWKTNQSTTPRYRLAPYEEAAPDGQWTRFICRFHATDVSSLPLDQKTPTVSTVILGETLSTFPYNYEYITYRKGKVNTLLTVKGKDNQLFWTSNLRFSCPVPNVEGLAELVASGQTVLSDGTPTLHVDVIPIRTPPRYGLNQVYFTEDMVGPKKDWGKLGRAPWENPQKPIEGFDPKVQWGDRNILPRIEASGRWENIPICIPPKPSIVESAGSEAEMVKVKDSTKSKATVPKKPHVLSACVWASASFHTRGKDKQAVTDTLARLEEWIEFHLMVGFDHIYI